MVYRRTLRQGVCCTAVRCTQPDWSDAQSAAQTPHHHTTTAPQHCGVTDCCVLCHNSATPQQQHQHQHQQERSGHYITLPCPLSTDPMFTVSKHLTKEVDTSKNLFILINFRSDILGAVHKLRDQQTTTHPK